MSIVTSSNRRLFGIIATGMMLISTFAFAADAPRALAGRKPNIIVVLTDDQGHGDLGRHGNRIIQTPNLDRLYDQSVRFTDFHVSPACAPTRSALLTGKHEFKNGITHTINERERLSLKSTTIVQLLKQSGYTTGIFGKWHLGDEPQYWPTRRGFDEMFIHGCGGIGQTYSGSCGDAPGNQYFNPVVIHNGTFVKTEGYCTDVFFAQSLKWIEKAKGQAPFFAYITPNAPHGPLICPEKYEKLYAGKVKPNEAKFFGMITNIDENVGQLVAKLKEWGIEKDTLVIYMNDNGGTAGCQINNSGMRGSKCTAFNGGTRAMSLWHWPGTLKPADVDKLTAHVDVFPTLAALAGATIPEDVRAMQDGFSLLGLLQGETDWPDRTLVTHVGRWPNGQAAQHKFGNCSVRWRQYNMVWAGARPNAKRAKAGPNPAGWALYDLKADPGETNNVAEQHPEVVQRLSKHYDQWWADILPCLINEDAWQSAPKINPIKELYWKQFRGPGPNNVPPPANLPLGPN